MRQDVDKHRDQIARPADVDTPRTMVPWGKSGFINTVSRATAVRLGGAHLALALLLLATGLVLIVRLDAAPRSYVDESWYAVPTVELLRHGVFRTPMLLGRGGAEHYYLEPKIATNLLTVPFVTIFGTKLFAFRLTSVAVGLLGLVGVYALARMLYGSRVALLGALFMATNPWFFILSRTFRPEIYVVTFATWYLVFVIHALATRSRRAAFAAGLTAGLALLSHQIAWLILTALSLAVPLALWSGGRAVDADDRGGLPRRWRNWAAYRGLAPPFVLGVALLLAPFALYVVWAQAVSSASFIQQLGGAARGSHTLDLAVIVTKEGARWATFLQFPVGAPLGAIYLLSWIAILRGKAWQDRLLAIALPLQVLVLAFGVHHYHGRYLTVLVPILGISMARAATLALSQATGGPVRPFGRAGTRATLTQWAVLSLAAAYFAITLSGVGALLYFHRNASYSQLMGAIRERVGADQVVAAPLTFWLGLHEYRFIATDVPRSFNEGYSTPSSVEWLPAELETSKPDVLLQTTGGTGGTLGLGPRPQDFSAAFDYPLLKGYLDRCGTLLDELPSRDFGPVRIWALDWRRCSTGR